MRDINCWGQPCLLAMSRKNSASFLEIVAFSSIHHKNCKRCPFTEVTLLAVVSNFRQYQYVLTSVLILDWGNLVRQPSPSCKLSPAFQREPRIKCCFPGRARDGFQRVRTLSASRAMLLLLLLLLCREQQQSGKLWSLHPDWEIWQHKIDPHKKQSK